MAKDRKLTSKWHLNGAMKKEELEKRIKRREGLTCTQMAVRSGVPDRRTKCDIQDRVGVLVRKSHLQA